MHLLGRGVAIYARILQNINNMRSLHVHCLHNLLNYDVLRLILPEISGRMCLAIVETRLPDTLCLFPRLDSSPFITHRSLACLDLAKVAGRVSTPDAKPTKKIKEQ